MSYSKKLHRMLSCMPLGKIQQYVALTYDTNNKMADFMFVVWKNAERSYLLIKLENVICDSHSNIG